MGGFIINTKSNVKEITILGLLAALELIFSFTPIGSIPIGPLCITLNIIPIALAAVVLGPIGGAVMGGIFGVLSFLQSFGVGVPSAFKAVLLELNPFYTFILCVVTRLLTGFIVGIIYKALSGKINVFINSSVTGFLTAIINTIFFMSCLVLLFGQTTYLQEMIDGKNILLWICAFVGVNAIIEMITCTIATGAVGSALYKSKLISHNKQ